MAITTPKYYDTKIFECDSPGLLDQISPYAIGFTKRDGFWWAVVLSFLFPVKVLPDFRTRVLKILCNKNERVDDITENMVKNVYEFLKKYNPFRNRNSCFYNEGLKSIVRTFKKEMLIELYTNNSQFRRVNLARRNSEPHLHAYVSAARKILESDIALCDIQNKNVKKVTFSSKIIPSESSLLTLYISHENENETDNIYYYGIAREFGMTLQKQALASILSSANVFPKNVECILRNLTPENSVVLTLVNQNMYSIIWFLFKQPHTLFKLSEAGYIVDPAAADALGNTALYYAIAANEESVVHQFCGYLSGTFQLSGVPSRSPEESVLTNLRSLNSILQEHKSKFENSKSKRALDFLEQLIKFVAFQISIISELLKPADMDNISTLAEVAEVEKRKKVIRTILSTYAKYFDFRSSQDFQYSGCDHTDDQEKFSIITEEEYRRNNFKSYSTYHQLLDFNVSLLFFDNLFSLKQNLVLSDNAYEHIESNFLRFILMCTFYNFSKLISPALEKMEKVRGAEAFHAPRSLCCPIVYAERLKLRKDLGEFEKILAGTNVQESNIVKKIPESEVETVISLPKIRDVLVFRTLVNYLDVASCIKFSSLSPGSTMEIQAVLIIERALQVVGEHLNERTSGDISLGKSLLVSSLPADLRKNLRSIRDDLSHGDGKHAECRRNVENDKETFEGIISELRFIRSRIEQSHRLLELLSKKYMLEVGRSHLIEYQKMYRKCKDLYGFHLKYKNLGKGLHLLCREIDNVRTHIRSFSQHCNLQTHFKYIYEYMFENQIMSKNDCNSKVLFHLNCVKVIFKHVFEAVKRDPDTAKAFTDKMNEIENLVSGLYSGDRSNKEETSYKEKIKDEVQQKEKFVMKKYDEIYNKSRMHITNVIRKIKHKKSNKGTLYTSISSKKFQDMAYSDSEFSQKATSCSLSEGKFDFQDSDLEEVEHTSGMISDCPYIGKLTIGLHFLYPLTAEDMRYVADHVPFKFKEHSKAKRDLLRIFQDTREQRVTEEEIIRALILKLLPSRDRSTLEKDFRDEELRETNIDILKYIKDHYGDMFQKLDRKEMMTGKDCKQYCDENLGLLSDEKSKHLLKKCVEGGTFVAKNDAVLKYLRDKVIALENLLIKSDPWTNRIWREVKSSKTRQHIVYRMKERYVSDLNLQSAIEMLLFDCMNLCERRADLERLWIKTSNLFNGINLRNVLAHGNLLLEEVGRILDPDDLPSEIITKCLEFVDDKCAIEAMCELFEKTGGTREHFVTEVKSKNSEYPNLCSAIRQNVKWESYASLIPKQENNS